MSGSGATSDPRWRRGRGLLARGEWFEAHEVLEDLWREHPPGPEREALQGLIQAAVALEHLRRGNPVGAAKVWGRAQARWEALESWPLGADLARWAEALVVFWRRVDLEAQVRAARAGLPGQPLPPPADWPLPGTGDA